jgi:uncharacterized OsmC-like protein
MLNDQIQSVQKKASENTQIGQGIVYFEIKIHILSQNKNSHLKNFVKKTTKCSIARSS